jgi:hypothetical protein
VFIHGCGAVSPAGWGVPCLRQAIREGQAAPERILQQPSTQRPLRVRGVPPAAVRPPHLAHARMRRSSAIARYSVAAALEALEADVSKVGTEALRLGIVFCAMSGCVNFSRQFCDEMLKDPTMASPLIFPETVFNAPASHLAALLGTRALYYTLVGDPGTFLQGIALAADWLTTDKVDGCLVIGAEEQDWLVAEAFYLFDPEGVLSEGAGALYLRRETERNPAVELRAVTHPHLYSQSRSRLEAARCARNELGETPAPAVLCDSRQGLSRLDRAEEQVWSDWSGARLSPKLIFGEGLMAAAAWQCVVAAEALFDGEYRAANVSIVGHNQQAIAAQFVRTAKQERSS